MGTTCEGLEGFEVGRCGEVERWRGGEVWGLGRVVQLWSLDMGLECPMAWMTRRARAKVENR